MRTMRYLRPSLLGFMFASLSMAEVQAPAPKAQRKEFIKFSPPDEGTIPNNEFGRVVRLGRDIFLDTKKHAEQYVGNSLNCVNCHLDRGRLPNSSPLWAAYVAYPAYRKKTNKVDTMQDRIQGCFLYSMNGKAPPQDSEIMTALISYQFWLATGAPTGMELEGRGYPELPKPARAPSWNEGEKVYQKSCTICHGSDGSGQVAEGKTVFPPLWGKDSFNWGAGMHRINTAAAFIRANMPLGMGGSLSEQEAWDVAYFINAHERPQDPRFKGNIKQTDHTFHDENCLYGDSLNGETLGSQSPD